MDINTDAAPIVEVYQPDSKPNASIQMERQPPRSLATLGRRDASYEQS